MSARPPGEMLSAMGETQILCALRSGLHGVEEVNRKVIRDMFGHRLNFRENLYFNGLHLMINRNDYQLELFNGDTGVVVKDPENNMDLRAFFTAADGSVRSFALSILPPHESCYAMTVHKSQGSEFDTIILVLPDKCSPLLTRELIYTAVTRARHKIEIWGSEDVFRESVETGTSRRGGLDEKLWGSSCF